MDELIYYLLILGVCMLGMIFSLFILWRNTRVFTCKLWMLNEAHNRCLENNTTKFFDIYNSMPSYASMVYHFWIPLNRYKREYIGRLDKSKIQVKNER